MIPRKKILLLLTAALFVCTTAFFAQCLPTRPLIKRWVVGFGEDADVYNGFHFGLWSKNTHTNGFDLGLLPLHGDSKQFTKTNGLAYGLVAMCENHVNGISLGTFWTYTECSNGLSFSPGLVYSDSLNGIGFGVLGTYAGRINGVALGTLLAYTDGNLNGLAFSPLVAGSSWNMKGIAIGGLFAFSEKNAKGFLISAVATRASMMSGLQLSLYNKTTSLNGIQIGAWNSVTRYSRNMFQLGLVNRAGRNWYGSQLSARGLQVGLLNISKRTRGLQLGLVNKTRSLNGVQIGAINIISRNPVWCRVMPLVNVSVHHFPVYYRSQLSKLLLPPGATLVKVEDSVKTGICEIQMQGGHKQGVTRCFDGNELVREEHYANDSLLETISYEDDDEYTDDVKRYNVIIERGGITSLYRINHGDTIERTVNGMREGRWKIPSEEYPLNHIVDYRHDSILSSYYLYTGKTIRFEDKELGNAELKPGDRTFGPYELSKSEKRYFNFNELDANYHIIRGTGKDEETWDIEYIGRKVFTITLQRHDSTIYMDEKKRVYSITAQEEEKSFFKDGSLRSVEKKLVNGRVGETYRKNGSLLLEEKADSLYEYRSPAGFADADTLGNLYATSFYKNKRAHATFAWRGDHFNSGKVYRKNGSLRIEAFPGKSSITFYYYKRNGKANKVKTRHTYGPMKKYLREAQVAPKNFGGGICN